MRRLEDRPLPSEPMKTLATKCLDCYARNETCLTCQGIDTRHYWQIPPIENWNIADQVPLHVLVNDEHWDGNNQVIHRMLDSLQPVVIASKEDSAGRFWAIEHPGVSWFRNYDCSVAVNFDGLEVRVELLGSASP